MGLHMSFPPAFNLHEGVGGDIPDATEQQRPSKSIRSGSEAGRGVSPHFMRDLQRIGEEHRLPRLGR